MHDGEYQYHMAASRTYYLPTIISQLFDKSHTKSLTLNEKSCEISVENKQREKTIDRKISRQEEAGKKENKTTTKTTLDVIAEGN